MLKAADLFCGAGGTSTGLLRAADDLNIEIEHIAVNHNEVAIATLRMNHPHVRPYNADLATIDPRDVVPGGKLELLVASPECTHFSRARGGRPVSYQSRASIKYVLHWVSALDVRDVLIENVPEFQEWGPLHRKHSVGCKPVEGVCSLNTCICGKPIKNRKGQFFNAFIRKMQEKGYQVKWRVLNAADYGDATTRKRLFIIARKGMTVAFPEPTHGRVQQSDLFRVLRAWRPAREIIDWEMKGESIFKRKKPLSENTRRRIMAGLMKFGGKAFVIGQQSQAAPRDVDQPLPTVAGAGAIAFVEPFILPQFSTGNPRSVEQPLSTITSTSRGIALIQPFLLEYHNGPAADGRTKSVDEPLPTLDTRNRFGLVEPFIIPIDHHGMGEAGARSVEQPMGTVTSKERFALVEPFIIPFFGERAGQNPRSHSVNEPLPTITSHGAGALVQPFLVEYHGTGDALSVDMPLKTQTGRDRFALVEPMLVKAEDGTVYSLDILFRMLHPRELAGAMSFPKEYKFEGNREQVVKQIGNAVPVYLAYALCHFLLSTRL